MPANLKIYNTLSGKKEVLKPLKNKTINLFVCGPTVYDFSHIGHARTQIVFDCFAKYLKFLGFKVFYLQNITDIDDRIIARSREKGVLPKDLARAFEKEYFKDMKAIGVNSIDKYARATDYIKEIINQVQGLMQKGYAYQLADGIYFDISKFKDYGKLSHRTVTQAEDSVSRIDYSKDKKNRGDFCLWKFSESESDWEPKWQSPFGKGRPGWHIEDTAITEKFFGPQYDIHGGGRDLIFPHHEAEVAQMEALSDKTPMSKYWMHIGFLTTGGQKMSKSLNNFITIDGFLKRHPYWHLRFWVIKNLWSSPISYSESAIVEAKSSLEKIEEFLRRLKEVKNNSALDKNAFALLLKGSKGSFYHNLENDFNTPKAFATLHALIQKGNSFLDRGLISKSQAGRIYGLFEEINGIFDFIDFKNLKQSTVPQEVTALVKEREQYRKIGNWQKADEMRLEIEKHGYVVKDSKDGPVLKK